MSEEYDNILSIECEYNKPDTSWECSLFTDEDNKDYEGNVESIRLNKTNKVSVHNVDFLFAKFPNPAKCIIEEGRTYSLPSGDRTWNVLVCTAPETVGEWLKK